MADTENTEDMLAVQSQEGERSEVPEGIEGLLDFVLEAHESQEAESVALPPRIEGIMVGRLLAIGPQGEPRVDYPGCTQPDGLPARAMASFGEADLGRDVALLFEGGDPQKPVIMGLMFHPGQTPSRRAPVFSRTRSQATVDGERLVFSADREIVLQCGEASITLTRAGKILLKGAYLLARSSGVNRIQGGSVQIN